MKNNFFLKYHRNSLQILFLLHSIFYPMGKGKDLTENEKSNILLLKKLKFSNREIGKQIQRSKDLVGVFLSDPENYGSKRIFKRKKKEGTMTIKQICRLASNKSTTSRQIKTRLKCSASRGTICRYLRDSGNLKYIKKQSKPPLTPEHKTRRLKFAENHTGWNGKWENIVFSDEKKFNLDGPDGFAYYWHDLRKEKLIFSKRVHGGGSLMIWGGFSSKGKTDLVFIETSMTASKYISLLEKALLPFGDQIHHNDYIFQQDNAPCHAANKTHEWFEENGITCMDWPSLSPDLNPIENVWGEMARQVYADGRQFEDINELKSKIIEVWNNISLEYLQKLVDSMKYRMFKLALSKGGSIDY